MIIVERKKYYSRIIFKAILLMLIVFISTGFTEEVSLEDKVSLFNFESEYSLKIKHPEYKNIFSGKINKKFGDIAQFLRYCEFVETDYDKKNIEYEVTLFDGDTEIEIKVLERPYIGFNEVIYSIDDISHKAISEMIDRHFIITKYNLQ